MRTSLRELRNVVALALREEINDVITVIVGVRVKITGDNAPQMSDLLTDLRGIEHVITVKQADTLSDPDMYGRQTGRLSIKYDEDVDHPMSFLLDEMMLVTGIDYAKVLAYDGIQYSRMMQSWGYDKEQMLRQSVRTSGDKARIVLLDKKRKAQHRAEDEEAE